MHDFISHLWKIVKRFNKKRQMKLEKGLTKFSTNKEHPFIEKMMKIYTPYAVELIAGEFHLSKAHYSATVVSKQK